jgi:hypothetical protein
VRVISNVDYFKSQNVSLSDDHRSITPLELPNSNTAAMQITNKHKVYVAVVGAAVAAFLIDRAYFTPSAALAVADLLIHSPPQTDALNNFETAGFSEGTIASKLKSISQPNLDQIPDAFAPSHEWINSVQPTPGHLDQFETTHKLSAVLASHNGGGAIINGQFVRIGQTVDGFTLTSINRQSAEFSSRTRKVTLSLDR